MTKNQRLSTLVVVITFLFLIAYNNSSLACSSFKLQKGDGLVYGHNLNQGDIGVPGILFINKRGMFKKGRTWSELTTKDHVNPSRYSWISRYGSVTFNNFGRDLPDGGMNESGLFVWEMSDDIEYPKDESLPKISQMGWMQYMLDMCSTVDEAVQCAYDFEIDGWGWHYFIGDAEGNTAAISFIKGEVVIQMNEEMPVPGLFNTPYERELELLKYYKGYGGQYDIDLNNSKVPRFVKTAVMINNYKSIENIVDYGLMMLDQLKVDDVPEWSILCDVRKMQIHFKTRINPKIKTLSFSDLDFSNKGPVLVLNMDVEEGGDVADRLHPYSNQKMKAFYEDFMLPIIPDEFFTSGGMNIEEFLYTITTHTDAAVTPKNQFFRGTWEHIPDKEKDDIEAMIILDAEGSSVSVKVSIDEGNTEFYPVENLYMTRNNLCFTFLTTKGTMVEVKAVIDKNSMTADFNGTEDRYGRYMLHRDESF